MARWHLGLDPKAIQDGTYADFHRGQTAELAVTFDLQAWEAALDPSVSVARVEGCRYDLVARVAATGDDWWVLDCGLTVASRGRPAAHLDVDHWVTGRTDLRVSPHAGLLQVDGVPPLTHTWFVERIHRRTEPDTGLGDGGLAVLEGLHGGPEEPGWEEVGFTDAWHDDDGRADYVLECLLVEHLTP